MTRTRGVTMPGTLRGTSMRWFSRCVGGRAGRGGGRGVRARGRAREKGWKEGWHQAQTTQPQRHTHTWNWRATASMMRASR